MQSREGTCSLYKLLLKRCAPIASVAALSERHAGWQCCGIDSLARGSLNCHCEEAAGRRGNLGKAVTFSPKVSCYPPRFCEIATGAKRPRNDKSGDFTVLTIAGTGRKCAAGRGQPGPYSGAHHLTTAGTGCKCLPEIAPQGHFLALRAQGATSACGLLAMTNLGRLPF